MTSRYAKSDHVSQTRVCIRRVAVHVLVSSVLALQTATPGLAAGQDAARTPTGAAEPREADMPVLQSSVAEAIGRAFIDCAARGKKDRSIHILDPFGHTLYAARMDGQFSDNIEVARLKAESALYFRENTTVWLERSRRNPQLALLLAQRGRFTSPTGFPIIVEGQLLGSVGVGGASGDCAYEALTRVLGPQPPWVPPAG